MINACICGIVVHPSYQKQGIGTEIVQKLVEKCREGNLHRHVNQFE
ncbi:GNAT family N-acetyltransferase [Paenibacillus sp. V4I7]